MLIRASLGLLAVVILTSSPRRAEAQAFTDVVLTPGTTPIKAVHLQELQLRVNAIRAEVGLSAISWPAVISGVTPVNAQHWIDLRLALSQAYAAGGYPAPSYGDSSVMVAGPVGARDVAAVREALTTLEGLLDLGMVTFRYQAGVTEAQRVGVRQGLELGASYLRRTFGWRVTTPLTVDVLATVGTGGITAFASRDNISVNSQSQGWFNANETRPKIMAHELFHVMQSRNGWSASFRWLVEGAAEYIGYRAAIIEPQRLSTATVQNCKIWDNNFSSPPTGPLASYEQTAVGNVYPLFYLAVERLVNLYGLDRLASVSSFSASFGATPEVFYTNFGAYRQTWVTPPNYNCPS